METQRGQALLESLLTYSFLFMISFVVVEVVRLQSFKLLLQSSVNYYSKHLAFDEMHLIRNRAIDINSHIKQSNEKVEKQITNFIAYDLRYFKTSFFSFDEGVKSMNKHNILLNSDFVLNDNHSNPEGVYLKATTCLPILFSAFLNKFTGPEKIIIGKSVKNDGYNRNCLGEFINSPNAPKVWFRVRAAAYSPWPASTQIFYHGIGIPSTISMINTKHQKIFKDRFEQIDFSHAL